jgi:hypothetical protein
MFKKIDEGLQAVIVWLFTSSADADKVSLSVKMALLGLIPYAMQAIGIVCGLDVYCVDVDQGTLTELAEGVGNLVFYALSVVSALGTVYGVLRKLWRSVTGTHRAFQA